MQVIQGAPQCVRFLAHTNSTESCQTRRCPTRTICVEENGVANCVTNTTSKISCAIIICDQGAECVEDRNGPKCLLVNGSARTAPVSFVFHNCSVAVCDPGQICIAKFKFGQCVGNNSVVGNNSTGKKLGLLNL